MPAYAIAAVDISDVETFSIYMELVPRTVEEFGGKYLVRGGAVRTIEGDWNPKRLVVIEFGDMEKASEWYNSEQYSAALKLRHKAADTSLVFVEGIF